MSGSKTKSAVRSALASVSRSSRGGGDDAGSEDADGGSFDLVGNSEKFDKCGLGYQGECFKAEGVFVSAGKTQDVATSAAKPKVKMSGGNAANGKTAVNIATDVKNVTATATALATATATAPERVSELKSASQRKFRPVCHHCGVVRHIRPRCFKLLRENNQMEQAYGLFKELIMEDLGSRICGVGDLITMEMVEWDFLLSVEVVVEVLPSVGRLKSRFMGSLARDQADECANLQKPKKKTFTNSDSKSESDYGKELKSIVAFTTFMSGSTTKSAVGSASASVSGSSCGGDDDAGNEDADGGSFDLVGNSEKLYEHWHKLVEVNSDLVKEKAKLEAQVAEALKYASERRRSPTGKTKDVATSATKPEVKMSAGNAANGKTTVNPATDVKNVIATATAPITVTATAPERGICDVTVSGLFKEIIMEDSGSRIRGVGDLITMEMVEWDFLLTLEDMDLHISF
ncbi:hypothetical protein DY000_02016174 [Brassica cretica]|uniref:Uncharacterized protein n=1 Tax=Brassica cretica TaxID=69181 RepID=A0ABQ7CVV4_BRACR|nr:hypothetical protein DY000_02016174 [Brassica cretica]